MGFADAQIKIPVAAVIVTKNEGPRLERCLAALSDFAEIFIVDSGGGKATDEIAKKYEAQYVRFTWNGLYPKKRQWCLENLPLTCDWVFFIDADEVVTRALLAEIKTLDFKAAEYFVQGAYV
jgi:glycosyltransferase involved in cell wall biosynthesis